jgi:hypothetical protein
MLPILTMKRKLSRLFFKNNASRSMPVFLLSLSFSLPFVFWIHFFFNFEFLLSYLYICYCCERALLTRTTGLGFWRVLRLLKPDLKH